ncbi:uncharacterized protein L201_006494 [Kwoniella dendrophila CBS 6074]|uniref:Uncharacterized protein n=1 Tax=Kwoniella dendrophila CBS 6074 TaxID=1295534 RepID=A0AAX4K365_9TREE
MSLLFIRAEDDDHTTSKTHTSSSAKSSSTDSSDGLSATGIAKDTQSYIAGMSTTAFALFMVVIVLVACGFFWVIWQLRKNRKIREKERQQFTIQNPSSGTTTTIDPKSNAVV